MHRIGPLDDALRLYGSRDSHEDLLSRHHPRRAGEEILGKLIERRGKDNALDSLKARHRRDVRALSPRSLDDKTLKDLLIARDRARNALKHLDAGGNPTVQLDYPKRPVDT